MYCCRALEYQAWRQPFSENLPAWICSYNDCSFDKQGAYCQPCLSPVRSNQRYHMIDLHISVFQIASAISTMTVALLVYCHSNAFWYCFSLCIHYFYLMFSLTKICVFHIIIILTHFMIIISLKAISLKSN